MKSKPKKPVEKVTEKITGKIDETCQKCIETCKQINVKVIYCPDFSLNNKSTNKG